MLLDKKQQKHKGAQEVLAALSFLEVEERTGRMSLDVTEFRYVVTRFCELARLNEDEVPIRRHVWPCCHEPAPVSLSQAQRTSASHLAYW